MGVAAIACFSFVTKPLPEELYYESGMTVAELQEVVKDWPKLSACGEENTVWIGSGHFSNPVKEFRRLNLRTMPNGEETGDLLLC